MEAPLAVCRATRSSGRARPYVADVGPRRGRRPAGRRDRDGQRLAVLRAGAGLGKSAVLARAVAETRGPHRRFARVAAPVDGPAMLAGLAAGLGVARRPRRGPAGRLEGLADAVKLCRWQKIHAVLVVDDCQDLDRPADRRDLERLDPPRPRPRRPA